MNHAQQHQQLLHSQRERKLMKELKAAQALMRQAVLRRRASVQEEIAARVEKQNG